MLRENSFGGRKATSGAKSAADFKGFSGTTKVVPFPKSIRDGVFRSLLGQCESDNGVAGGGVVKAAAGIDQHDVLFAVFPFVGHGHGVRSGFELGFPEHFPAGGIEGAETLIVGRRNKQESACSRD